MPERCRCEILRSTQDLENFRLAWRALWNEDSNATPFQSPEWLLPWWHQFGQPDLRAIIVWDNGKLIAFVPFYIYCQPSSKERQLLLVGAGTTDYLDGVFAPECRQGHVQLALDLLRKEGGWDVLYAGQLRRQSILFQTLQQAKDLCVQQLSGESCSRMPAVLMPDLPVKIRRNVMYYRNRAMRLGTLELVVADRWNCPAFFDALVYLHTARWQSCGEPGVLADRRVLAWHREAIPMLQEKGMLRLCLLSLNDEILGVAYSLIDPAERWRRAQYIYLTAHSLEYADLRPGTLLLGMTIDRAAEEGIEVIDMLRGDEAYKKLWHVEPRPTYGFEIRYAQQERRLLSA